MDVRCPVCAEPFDIDHLHDVVHSENLETADGKPHNFDTLYAAFTREGCSALGEPPCKTHPAATGLHEMAELAGDDIEFFASMCEDLLG